MVGSAEVDCTAMAGLRGRVELWIAKLLVRTSMIERT